MIPDPWIEGVYTPWFALVFVWLPWFVWRVRELGWRGFLRNRPALIMAGALLLIGWVWTDIQFGFYSFGNDWSDARAWAFFVPLVLIPFWDIWLARSD